METEMALMFRRIWDCSNKHKEGTFLLKLLEGFQV